VPAAKPASTASTGETTNTTISATALDSFP
jgi:hypothetical protein